MTGWTDLDGELALWDEAGLVATLWWRDDDAVSDSSALRRLLEIANVPLALAVIPADLQPSLVDRLAATADTGSIAVLQHGFSHLNHEPPDRKKAELGTARPVDTVMEDLKKGREILRQAFSSRALTVLTPPWNRVAPAVVAGLPAIGFSGLSTYLPRIKKSPVPSLRQVNTHVDLIDWHGGGGFIGLDAALHLLTEHLRARRIGDVDAVEPTGLLTHHLVQDEATWAFLVRLQDFLSSSPVIRWLQGDEVFAEVAEQDNQ